MKQSKIANLVIMQITVVLLLGALLLLLNQFVSTSLAAPSSELFSDPSGSGYECSQIQPCSLQTALSQTNSSDTLYLAQGTYTGSGAAVMMLDHNLSVYGGWNGATTGSLVLDPVAYRTILDAEDQRRGVEVNGPVDVLLDGFTITRGKHDIKGAGLFAADVTLNLRRMVFSGNVISATLEGSPFGGGATIEGGSIVISDTTFLNNAVRGRRQPKGGGLAISDTVTAEVVNSFFQNNDSWVASGLYFLGSSLSPLLISDNHFEGNGHGRSNKAAYGGYRSAMEITGSDAHVMNNVILDNYAVHDVGGIGIYSSRLAFHKNILSGNESLGNSALSINYTLPYTFTLANNIIADNVSSDSGDQVDASVRIRGSIGQMFHNTLARNQGIRGGVSVTRNSNVELTNNTVVSHTVGISVTSGSVVSLEATLWGSGAWANGEDWGGDGTTYIGSVNLWSLPGFVDPDQGDYHIGPDSTAVDAGVSAEITDDIDGDARPSGAGYDIGADEVPTQREWVLYIPQLMR